MTQAIIRINRHVAPQRQNFGALFRLWLVCLLLVPFLDILFDHHAAERMPNHRHLTLGEANFVHMHLPPLADHHLPGDVQGTFTAEVISVYSLSGMLLFVTILLPAAGLLPQLPRRLAQGDPHFAPRIFSFWPPVPTRPPR